MRWLLSLLTVSAISWGGCGEGIIDQGEVAATRRNAEGPGLRENREVGESCTRDYDCGSGVCGCSHGSEMRCLASRQELTPCSPEPRPIGHSCSRDEECASETCGCDGGTYQKCLRRGGDRSCLRKQVGAACRVDVECETNWCGCDGGWTKICLPNKDYSKLCSSPPSSTSSSPRPPTCPPAGSSAANPPTTLGDLAGQECDYSCWGDGTISNICGVDRWQYCLRGGVFAACQDRQPASAPAPEEPSPAAEPPPSAPPPPSSDGCPCFSPGSGKDNFCHHAPGTAGCPMTAQGGYCDPNGDKSFEDGDWTRGWSEHLAKCGG